MIKNTIILALAVLVAAASVYIRDLRHVCHDQQVVIGQMMVESNEQFVKLQEAIAASNVELHQLGRVKEVGK